MKTQTTYDRIQVRTLPTGRLCVVAQDTREVIEAMSKEGGDLSSPEAERVLAVKAICVELDAHSLTCADIERRYAVGQTMPSPLPGKRLPIDRQADQLVTTLRDAAKPFIKGLDEDEAAHQAAKTFIAEAFPLGVKHITHASYPDQLQRMKALVTYCQGPGADHVSLCGLGVWVSKLAAILPDYDKAIRALPPDSVRFAQVKAQRTEGHRILRRLVVDILSGLAENNARHEGLRQQLLAPLQAQEDAMTERRRRRLPPKDLDPTTREEVDPVAPLDPEDSEEGQSA